MNLKPPVNIEDLMREWSEDTNIRADQLDLEILKISNLHGKYLNIMSYHRHMIRKLEKDFKDMKSLRTDYYNGYMAQEDLEKYGWEQYMHPKPTNPQLENLLASDSELTKILMKKSTHEEIVLYCENVLRSLNGRGWEFKTYVEFQKFIKGH